MLQHLPPSTATDLAVDRLSGAEVTDAGDHLVVRTPANPDYHWGNFIQVTTGDPDDAERWLQLFAHHFPEATHRAVGLPGPSAQQPWTDRGLREDVVESLTLRGVPSPTDLPAGYTVAPLTDDAAWEARLRAELHENAVSGEYPADEYAAFMTNRIAARRDLVDAGHARWLGAWTSHGELAASMGIVVLPGEPRRARYQSVLTHPEHRRRGLARHLLQVTGQWAAARGAEELVIVADDGSVAGRLYRGAGFTPGALGHGWYAASWPVPRQDAPRAS